MKPDRTTPTRAASKLVIHKDSHVITKFKPIIRIIHIRAPEIIKADVKDFRELVQRLTGKPADKKTHKEKTSIAPAQRPRTSYPEQSKINEPENGVHVFLSGEAVKKESEEMWGSENPFGFIGGFGDINGLFEDMSEFPNLLPLKSSHFNIYGGMPLCQ